jgi:hypothetical protein
MTGFGMMVKLLLMVLLQVPSKPISVAEACAGLFEKGGRGVKTNTLPLLTLLVKEGEQSKV